MNDDDCRTLWNQAVDAGLAAVPKAKGRSIYVLSMRTGVIEVIPEEAPGHCDVILEKNHEFSRWLVQNKIAMKISQNHIIISDRSRTGLAVASEMFAIALATVLDDASVPVIKVAPARHLG